MSNTMEDMFGQDNLFMCAAQEEKNEKVEVIYKGKIYKVSKQEAERVVKLGGILRDGKI